MKADRQQLRGVGVAGVACAACCAGPVIGFFAALGLGTTIGLAGSVLVGVLIAIAGILLARHRRRARQAACAVPSTNVAVAVPTVRART